MQYRYHRGKTRRGTALLVAVTMFAAVMFSGMRPLVSRADEV